MNLRQLLLFAVAMTFLGATDASAYIGPGLGAGAVAAVFGVIGSVFLGLFAVLYYPIKRAFKRRRSGTSTVMTKQPEQ